MFPLCYSLLSEAHHNKTWRLFMTNINIGNKIRELRKKKGITQEVLASVLSVSPQAVSKWESGLTYPDMEMIPIIAGYFEVSLDILFEYDVREMKAKIQKIIDTDTSLDLITDKILSKSSGKETLANSSIKK